MGRDILKPSQGRAGVDGLLPRLHQMHERGRKDTQRADQRPSFTTARAFAAKAARGSAVDLRAPCAPAPAYCRCAARARLEGENTLSQAYISPGNLILTAHGPALMDWDKARRDLRLFDLPPEDPIGHTARLAWESAGCWYTKQDHASSLATHWSETPRHLAVHFHASYALPHTFVIFGMFYSPLRHFIPRFGC